MTQPVPSTLVKTYAQRGPLQQFRFAENTAFVCVRCGRAKKSKLIVVYQGDWSKKLCNGCYGRLLSLYEIKAGTDAEDEKADKLASALLSIVAIADQRRSEQSFSASENRAALLSTESLRFISTSEHVAQQLDAAPNLEWSPAVIGLCKAVEVELVQRLLRPLAVLVGGEALAADKADKDLGRVATFCGDSSRKPPEIGTFAHFLQTVIHSESRRDSSPLIRGFLKLTADLVGSNWLLDKTGMWKALVELLGEFRNRAAHIDELSKDDYVRCRDLVIGPRGILWMLVLATQHQKLLKGR
jgi:hypothetical protein